MAINPYTDKYKSPEKQHNIALLSIEICERSIAIISSAKESLANGDKPNWFRKLGKLSEEFGHLNNAVNNPQLGEFGQQMQMNYLRMSLVNSKIILDDSTDPAIADELLALFQEVRDYWKEILKKSDETKSQSSDDSTIGGLI